MRIDTLNFNHDGQHKTVVLRWVHTLVIGSGAAGLNAAVQLYANGIQDILILTEGLQKGTSINTGSDKQTYYKLSMCGTESDSPRAMAENYVAGGAMHGDLALVEASLSARAFMHLVNLGVPFPRDSYGQFVGYKTDHDPRQRATSIGPYTSREMCRSLAAQVRRLGISVADGREVIRLVCTDDANGKRVVAALALGEEDTFEAYAAENIIFAVGGPGGLYKTSVYPEVHFGSIGLALMAGADARNLPESQYGLASTQFRWNVSGTYMQVIPRFISRAADGISDEREFLTDYFESADEMNGNVFLKGYQWPFDARKAIGGSSIVDILVYIETVEKGRRVYLDFRSNAAGYDLVTLPDEARNYLSRSGAVQATPIERLVKMNPGAIALYMEHGIDLHQQPLEIAVCAQHNNGGLAANLWWESTNLRHFFPVGEVNGSHGVSRPGGSALNAGQVGGFRAAEFIAAVYPHEELDRVQVEQDVLAAWKNELNWIAQARAEAPLADHVIEQVQQRMSRCGAHIRSVEAIQTEVEDAIRLVAEVQAGGCRVGSGSLREVFRARQLAFAHQVYLGAVQHMLLNKVGSRGSSIVLAADGAKVHPMLGERWRIQPEDPSFRKMVLVTSITEEGQIEHQWESVRSIPEPDSWFETTWAAFRSGEIYRTQ